MMRNLISLISVLALAFNSFSQTPFTELERYQKMKVEGSLPSNFTFSDAIIFEPTEKSSKASDASGRPAGSCGCYTAPDATYSLALGPNDDGSTSSLSIPFNFTMYGTNYTSLYINTNGNVSFGASYSTFSSNPFPDPSFIMVAPFWGDVDTRGTGTIMYKITPTAMYVNWEGVGYFNQATDKLNTFQLIITDGNDPVLPTGKNIAFCYGDMQWTTGDASGGINGFGGTPSTVGVNKGDGISFIQLGRFDQPGAAYDGGGGLNDGVSWLDYQSLYFDVSSGTNIAPIANFTPSVFNSSGGGSCDTLRMCGINDTLLINALFLSPEIGETTTVSVNLNGIPGISILNNTPGNPASVDVQIIASAANAGMNTITFTATDNGIPSQTTTVSTNIFVDTTGLAAFNPAISGITEFCDGGSSTLSVSPTTFNSYIWNTGATGTSIPVNDGGNYWVTSELNGCYKTVDVNIIEHPLPTPLILGPLFNCTGNPTTLYLDSAELYTSISWSNGSTNDSIIVGNGTYTVTVVDTGIGCSAMSSSVTISNNVPTVSINGDSTYCQNDSTTLTAVPNFTSGANYLWSTGATTSSINVPSTGNVWVTVSYSNGCSVSDTLPISAIPIIFNIHNDTICQGSSFLLPGGLTVTQAGSYVDTLTAPSTNCDSVLTTILTVNPSPDATISAVNPICDNSPITILTAATPGGIWSGQGISNSTNGEFDPSTVTVGQHQIIYTVTTDCGAADTINIIVNGSPDFSYSAIEDTCFGSLGSASSMILSGSPPFNYLWSNGNVSSGILNVLAGTYSLSVTDSNNCSTTKQVIVNDAGLVCEIIAPNVITPNGDGHNDVLFFSGLDRFPNSSLEVFNRWGLIMYQSDNYQNNWTPTDVSEGTYFYILTPEGSGPIKQEPLKGFFSILK